MLMVLSNLYNDSPSDSRLILTNFPFMALLKAADLAEDEYGTKKNTEALLRINENMGRKCLISKYKLLELTSSESIEKIKGEQ